MWLQLEAVMRSTIELKERRVRQNRHDIVHLPDIDQTEKPSKQDETVTDQPSALSEVDRAVEHHTHQIGWARAG